MGDASAEPRRCAWCGDVLPAGGRAGARYCRAAHRQAAYRRRHTTADRAAAALNCQVAILAIADALAERSEIIQATISEYAPKRLLPAGGHTELASGLATLTDDLLGAAVIADRRSGSSWDDIGAALHTTAGAARARYGRRRMTVEWPTHVSAATPGASAVVSDEQ